MAEEVANIEVDVKDMKTWSQLIETLMPTSDELLVDAAKRCAAMAGKLPEAQRRARRLRDVIHFLRRECGIFKSAYLTWRRSAHDEARTRREVQAKLRNWLAKAARIATALGVREGESLVQAAERVARLKAINFETAKTALCQLGDDDALRARAEKAEAEAARWKKALEDQQLASEKGRFLVGPWMVERDGWKERAASFERIANELRAELNKQALSSGRCPKCGVMLIDATAKGDKAVNDYCPNCGEIYSSQPAPVAPRSAPPATEQEEKDEVAQ